MGEACAFDSRRPPNRPVKRLPAHIGESSNTANPPPWRHVPASPGCNGCNPRAGADPHHPARCAPNSGISRFTVAGAFRSRGMFTVSADDRRSARLTVRNKPRLGADCGAIRSRGCGSRLLGLMGCAALHPSYLPTGWRRRPAAVATMPP